MSPIDHFQLHPIQLISICSPFGAEQAPAELYIDNFIIRLDVQLADYLSQQRLLPVSSSQTIRVPRKRSQSVFENQK